VKKKMKKIWIGIGIAVILALLNGCGGGGGGPSITPTSPPTSDEVSKLLPMEQNQTLKYSWTVSSSINANATGNFEIGQKRFQLGPIPLLIPLPKFLPQRDGTHNYSGSASAKVDGTLTNQVITTNSGVTFPANWPSNIVTVETDIGQGSGSATATLSIDGKPQTKTQSVNLGPLLAREFLTNDNGKVQCWGMQTKNTDWGSVVDFSSHLGGSPLLLLQAAASSWDVVPHIENDIFSADVKATLLGKGTYGGKECYVVRYTLENFKLKTLTIQDVQITKYNLSSNRIDVWYAPNTGMVHAEGGITLTAEFSAPQYSATGKITNLTVSFSTSLQQ
jgi:hypothetical protein